MSLNNIKIWCCSVTYDQIYNFHQHTNYIFKQTKNRRCIPLEFRCILHLIYFDTISFIHHFYSASSSPLLLRSSSFILLQPFEIAIQTTYKKQITWNGNNGTKWD